VGTYDVTIVLTVMAEDETEVEDMLLEQYNLDIDDPPSWGAIAIRKLKA
jgi:hypothetical protein